MMEQNEDREGKEERRRLGDGNERRDKEGKKTKVRRKKKMLYRGMAILI